MPPQINARLVSVTAATAATGGRDEWDGDGEPAGAGAVKWEGNEGAYLSEHVDFTPGATANVTHARTLYIDSAIARAASIDTDDVLTFIDPAGVERSARAVTVAIRELAGIPATLQTARLDLEAV